MIWKCDINQSVQEMVIFYVSSKWNYRLRLSIDYNKTRCCRHAPLITVNLSLIPQFKWLIITIQNMVICQGNDWKIKKLNLSIKNKTDFLFIKEKKTFPNLPGLRKK